MRDIEFKYRSLSRGDGRERIVEEPAIAKVRTERLQDKIAALKEQMRGLKEIEVRTQRSTRQTGIAYGSRCSFDEDTRNGGRRLQRADRG